MRFAIKIRFIFRRNNAFSESLIEKSRDRTSNFAARIFGRNYFDEFHIRGGLKKCMPRKFFLKSSENGSAIFSMGMPEVFEAITAPGFIFFSTSAKSLCLISEIFNDRFDDKIAIFELMNIVFKISDLDQTRIILKHKRRRF